MKIVSLHSENVKRLRAVHIEPDGAVVVIGGANGQGKSSVIDSIFYALAGKGALPPKPVRDGQEAATIALDLGDIMVARSITPDGKSTLKVTSKEGARFPSPQDMLDNLVGNLSFDPLDFSRMDPKEQVDTLKAMVGLDFSKLDQLKAEKTETRKLIGREHKALEGQLAGMRQHPDAPREETSVAKLAEELKLAQQHNAICDEAAKRVKDTASDEQTAINKVAELEQKLAEAKEKVKLAMQWKNIAEEEAKALVRRDESAIITRMSQAESINRQVRENRDRRSVATKVYEKGQAYDKLTEEIAVIDQQKAEAMAAAKFPVPGLAFDESGVTVKGIPFQQASAAEQLRVSVAMGLALNPKLKVLLVRDGSLLDANSMRLLATMAEEAGAQVWLERVGNADASAIVIEDGQVKS